MASHPSAYAHQTSGNLREDGNFTAAGKGRVCIPTADKNLQFKKLKAAAANQVCFDCPAPRPTWASVTYGALNEGGLTTTGRAFRKQVQLESSLTLLLSCFFSQIGVFLCLDCSATHRSMGVHTSFVRSVDLDEWTQSQIDAMRLGGNGPARTYFRKQGVSDMHGKIEKKYTSKAAQMYRVELQKLVNAEAAKRGEASAADAPAEETASLLLQNLDLQDQAEQDRLAKERLAAARAGAGAAPAQPVAKLASELPGARGKLLTPPSSGNAPTLVLRKPAGSSSSLSTKNLLKKKPSGTLASKLRVNKLVAPGSSAAAEADFEDIESTQKAAAETEKEAAQLVQDEAAARKLQQQEVMNGASSENGAAGADGFVVVESSPVPEPKPVVALPAAVQKSPVEANLEKKTSSIEEQVAKLKMLNSDFFADM